MANKDKLKIFGLLIILGAIITWRIIENNKNVSTSPESNPTPVIPPNNENNEDWPYSYEDAQDRFNEEKNPQDTDNPKNSLQDDPIWKLLNGSKIVQVDFMITPRYVDNHIRLDVSLSMTRDELLESEKYKTLYINKVLNYLRENGINSANYEMNYIIPNS